MVKRSILFIGLIILNWNNVHGDDSTCWLFYSKLYELPHNELTINTNGFVSLWDGKKSNGCEVIFKTDESKVEGEVVNQKFESFINFRGWSINENLIADGPGSSTIGIEKNGNMCLVNWSQPSWFDEKTGEIRQSDEIQMVIQCSINSYD